MRFSPSAIALSASALALPTVAFAQETRLAPVEIYGDVPASQVDAHGQPRPRDPGLRARGGIQFVSAGIASNFQYYGTGGGGGIGFHLGGQINNLVGVYLSARFDTLVLLGYGEGDVIVDFTLRDRVQVGAGLGIFGTYQFGFFSSGGAGGGIVVPFHFGVTPVLWHTRDGGRTGLHLTLDLAPGIGLGGYYGVPFGFSAATSLGWEWF